MNAVNHSNSPDFRNDTSKLAPPPGQVRRSSARTWLWGAAVVLVLGGAFAGAWWYWPGLFGGGNNVQPVKGPRARVTKGTLVISVTDDGEVTADKQRVIRNELRWPAYIEWVAPKGVIVPKGEPIIKFKCDELEEAIVEQAQKVAEAKNDLERAKANLELKKKESEYLVQKAQWAVKDAEEAEKRYGDPGGEGDTKLKQAKSDIALAQQNLALADKRLAFKLAANEKLAPNSPYSKNEIKADELEIDRIRLSLSKAEDNLKMLEKYDLERDKRKLNVATQDAKLAYGRAQYEADREIAKAQQEMEAKEFVFKSHDKRHKELLEDRDTKLVIKADEDGLVVYDIGRDHFFRGDEIEVDVGEKVNPRQRLMIIPDMTTLQVETKVYENMISELEDKLGARERQQLEGRDADQAKKDLEAKLRAVKDLPEAERTAALAKLKPKLPRREGKGPGSGSRPATLPATRPDGGRQVPASVKIPALGGLVVKGHVEEVSPMGEEKNRWLTPGVKVYTVIVKLDDRILELRPTMTARVTLVLAELPNVLKAPVAAVFSDQDKTYCWRVNSGLAKKAEIKIGRTNESEVQILSGLQEGDDVLLVTPVGARQAKPGEDKESPPQGPQGL